jgi:predicted amidohydrolase
MARATRIAVVQPDSPRYINPYDPTCTYESLQPILNANIQNKLDLAEQAAEQGVDLVVTPEDSAGSNCYAFRPDEGELYRRLAETVPGPTTQRASKLAATHAIHLVINLLEVDGDHYHNTSVLIGPNGQIIGKYRKVHLALEENYFLTAGDHYPVFDTDLGRIGLLICFDVFFPESATCLALNGADLICLSTYGICPAGDADQTLRVRARACDNSVYFAMSMYGSNKAGEATSHPGRSCIVDLAGNVLADAAYWADSIAVATVDMDRKRYDEWNAVHSGITDYRAFILSGRRPATYSLLGDTNTPLHQRCQDQRMRSLDEYQAYAREQQRRYREK